ncbi:MAG TPA: GNAT family N-acetyltransferase [Polyangiaceae bacterium]|nr:GNAT family N-acetyltransferase [Polyangiaceae bacterium]
MNEAFTVRPATIADYDQMCALLAEVDELHRVNLPWMFQKPAAEPRPSDFFERLLENDDSELLVADAGHGLVGVAMALLRQSPDFALFVTQSWCVLDNIAVAQAFRRRGVGSALIRAAERWARHRGANWIELGVYEFNEAARAFYQALGYGPVSTKLRKPLNVDP